MLAAPAPLIILSALCLPSLGLRIGEGSASLGIPKVVVVAAPYPRGSPEHRRILDALALERGVELQYFDDEDTRASAESISRALEDEGVVSSAYEAYTSLRPFAYKADLWRYMVLWHQGGVYLDMNIQLWDDLSSWIDFDRDELVLVNDQASGRYWTGMMASRPRCRGLAAVIRDVVRGVLSRSYGEGDLDITGPQALSRSLQRSSERSRVRASCRLREEAQGDCGSYPKPPCRVRIYSSEDGSVLATKARPRHESAQDHYSSLYKMHAVYCDEPGPPCR